MTSCAGLADDELTRILARPVSCKVSRKRFSARGLPNPVGRRAVNPADQLRHACGFKLANDGHDTRSLQHWLGHKNISNTTIYTAMASDRFKDFWR
jgi:site-specific recombinase XerC